MKKTMLILLAVLLPALALTGCTEAETPGYRRISMAEAAEWMEREENYVLLDVRTEAEYEAGHIPGAVLLPNEEIGGERPDKLPDPEQLILVYCRSGNRSQQASDKLARMGYLNIVEIGGINSWPGEVVTG